MNAIMNWKVTDRVLWLFERLTGRALTWRDGRLQMERVQ